MKVATRLRFQQLHALKQKRATKVVGKIENCMKAENGMLLTFRIVEQ
jgi:hypothetical protein